MKNKRQVTKEVKECSRTKAQKCSSILHKKDVYNNCLKLRSRAIKNIPGRLPENSRR